MGITIVTSRCLTSCLIPLPVQLCYSRANICPILFCLFVSFDSPKYADQFLLLLLRHGLQCVHSHRKNQFVFYVRQTNSLWLVRRKFVTARGSSLLAGGDNPQTTNTKWWKFSSFVFSCYQSTLARNNNKMKPRKKRELFLRQVSAEEWEQVENGRMRTSDVCV